MNLLLLYYTLLFSPIRVCPIVVPRKITETQSYNLSINQHCISGAFRHRTRWGIFNSDHKEIYCVVLHLQYQSQFAGRRRLTLPYKIVLNVWNCLVKNVLKNWSKLIFCRYNGIIRRLDRSRKNTHVKRNQREETVFQIGRSVNPFNISQSSIILNENFDWYWFGFIDFLLSRLISCFSYIENSSLTEQ